jgi:hypothetical protein
MTRSRRRRGRPRRGRNPHSRTESRPQGLLAYLGNPDPVDPKVYCPQGEETFDDETTGEAPSRGNQ